jgi:putative ABC transport system substrate-binding protein
MLGWIDGHNLRLEIRWASDDVDKVKVFAKEMVDLPTDVVLAGGSMATAALQQQTRTIPIVFAVVGDPVGAGFVANLSRPGGNITGFIGQETGMMGKWLELLTEIAPRAKRVAVMFNPDTAIVSGYLHAFHNAAASVNIEPTATPVHSEAEIDQVIISLGREPKGGLVVVPDGFMFAHRASIITSAARNSVPAVYFAAVFTRDGGLLSYGPDRTHIFRHGAASYVDRLLRGERVSELPVQLPTKFEMVLNARTARALGLDVPPTLLTRADEVIE